MDTLTVAVIGSFRRNMQAIQDACSAMRDAGIVVTSPRGVQVLDKNVPFVRFITDDVSHSDEAVQSLTLHRIFRASLVYVVSPDGYIGRTTCYEIGRVIQNRKPIYFSSRPVDLPLSLPDWCIQTPNSLIEAIHNPAWSPQWLYDAGCDETIELERSLLEGSLRDD